MHLTTVYPTGSPGGWNILGTALQALYDPHRREPFLLAAGDRVRLVPDRRRDPPPISPVELLPPTPQAPALRVDEPGLLDLVVDGGRFGQAHAGMAESGPADRAAALLANALVGNPAGTALVEMTLNGPQLTALRPLVVGLRRHRRRARGGRRGRRLADASASRPGAAPRARHESRRALLPRDRRRPRGAARARQRQHRHPRAGRPPLRAGDVLGARPRDAGRAAAGATRAARSRPADPPAARAAARRGGVGRAVRRRLHGRRRRPHRRAPRRAARSRRRDPVRVAAAGRAAGDAGAACRSSCSPTACGRRATPSRPSCTRRTSAAWPSCAPAIPSSFAAAARAGSTAGTSTSRSRGQPGTRGRRRPAPPRPQHRARQAPGAPRVVRDERGAVGAGGAGVRRPRVPGRRRLVPLQVPGPVPAPARPRTRRIAGAGLHHAAEIVRVDERGLGCSPPSAAGRRAG